MLRSILILFKNNPWYRNLVTGMFLSAVGSGLTQTAIYAQLSSMHAGTYTFGVAFAASLLPGLLSSQLGAKLTRSIGPFAVLLIAELGGTISLGVPLVANELHVASIFQLSTLLPGLFGGLCVGASSLLIKANFSESEYPAIASLDAALFTGIVIVANGIGALLVTVVPFNVFLSVDASTYIIGAISLWFAKDYCVNIEVSRTAHRAEAQQTLSRPQIRAFIALPLMAMVTTPAMALLPAFGAGLGITAIGPFAVSATAALLFAKTVGQLIGPFIVPPEKVGEIFNSNRKIVSLLFAFLVFYGIAFASSSLWLCFVAVVLAHISTNVIFVSVESTMYTAFPEERFASVMVKRYQLQVLLMGTISVLSAVAASRTSIYRSYLLFSLPSAVLFVLTIPSGEKKLAA